MRASHFFLAAAGPTAWLAALAAGLAGPLANAAAQDGAPTGKATAQADAKAAPDPKQAARNEALFEAARNGDAAAAKKLLAEGADPNARNPYGGTPLGQAADKGHVGVVEALLAAKADPNLRDTFYGADPLLWAGSRGHAEVVRALLKAGAKGGASLVAGAAEAGNVALLKVVLEHAKPSAALLGAALRQAPPEPAELAELLKQAGAKAEKVEPVPADPELLAACAGTYNLAGAGELKVETDGKFLRATAGDWKIKLAPVGGTKFASVTGSGVTVQFVREAGQPAKEAKFWSGLTTRAYVRGAAAAAPAETGPAVDEGPYRAVAKLADWPQFRGVGARGVADGQFPPTSFDAAGGRNVRWKTPIPGLGHSCPVVVGPRAYLTTAISGDPKAGLKPGLYGDVDSVPDDTVHQWRVYCVDLNTGRILWDKLACEGKPRGKRHLKSTHANPTPACDGQRLLVSFGSEGLYCYSVDGDLLWKKDLGNLAGNWFYDPGYEWGFGSSPIVQDGLAYVQCDVGKGSFVAAFDLRDGKEVWRTGRDEIPSWGTPTWIDAGGRKQLVANATKFVRGYDAATGKELWRLGKNSEITVPTPFFADDHIFVCSGYRPIQPIYAVKPDAVGDITLKAGEKANAHIAWSSGNGPYMPTPLVADGCLHVLAISGVLTVFDSRTGKQLYRERLKGRGGFTAALVAADGRLYCTGEESGVTVVATGPKFRLLARNPIDDICMATPAISDGVLLVRSAKALWAFARPKPGEQKASPTAAAK